MVAVQADAFVDVPPAPPLDAPPAPPVDAPPLPVDPPPPPVDVPPAATTPEKATLSLDGLAAAARAGSHDEVLGALLPLWQRSRSRVIAEAIVSIGKLASKGREVPRARRARDELTVWTQRAALGDPRDLDVLLPNMALGSSQSALERLQAVLGAFRPDPRIGRALVALLEAPPFHAETTMPFWEAVGGALLTHGDAETKASLEALRGTFATKIGEGAVAEALETFATRAASEIPAGEPLTNEEAAAIASLGASPAETATPAAAPPPALAAAPSPAIVPPPPMLSLDAPDDALVAELEKDLHDPSRRADKVARAAAIAAKLFAGRAALPKRLLSELTPLEKRFLVAAVALGLDGLSGYGFFVNRETTNRWLGVLPQGPVDVSIAIPDGASLPIWRILSDGFHGLLPPTTVAAAFASCERGVARAALEEMLEPAMPYELWRNDGGDEGDATARAQRHNERKADVLAKVALAIAPDGEEIARAIAKAEAPTPLYARHADRCLVSSLVLLRAAHARVEEPIATWDVLVAEGLKTSPEARAPAITEELLRMLPPERADAISADAAKVFRVGRVNKSASMRPPSNSGMPAPSVVPSPSFAPASGRPAWDTITFDGTLRYLAPTRRGAERAVLAIEEWERVLLQTPPGEPPPPPLPREELLAFFERVGPSAIAPLDAALERAIAAGRTPHEALEAARSRLATPS